MIADGNSVLRIALSERTPIRYHPQSTRSSNRPVGLSAASWPAFSKTERQRLSINHAIEERQGMTAALLMANPQALVRVFAPGTGAPAPYAGRSTKRCAAMCCPEVCETCARHISIRPGASAKYIEIGPTHRTCRLPCTRDFLTLHTGNFTRQQMALDFVSRLQLCLLCLELDLPKRDLAFEFPIPALQTVTGFA